MELQELISEELIECRQNAAASEAAIEILGKALARRGYIKPAYTTSVLERERDYPTGIALADGGIAIPHATPDGNVLKDGIAVLQLAAPVEFHSMENPEEIVQTRLVFMLALKDAGDHLAALQKLFGMFQSTAVMDILRRTTDKNIFKTTLLQNLK